MKIMLVIPEKDSIREVSKFLNNDADLYVFPEGFLNNDTIHDALNIMKDTHSCVITGFKDNHKKTRFGVVGIPICYEIHFPEVSRIMMIDKPLFLLNIIGSGMYDELQYEQWVTIAKTRAIENETFVLECSHYCGPIPIAFAFSPSGQCISLKKNAPGNIVVEIDLKECHRKTIGYWEDRVPELFTNLSNIQNYI